MSETPADPDKKRTATSPLDVTDLKKSRAASVKSACSDDSISVNLDDVALEKIADFLSAKFEARLFSKIDIIQKQVTSLESENATMRAKIAELEQRLDHQDRRDDEAAQYSRRICPRVTGVK